jgi:hypothetical protein
VAVVLQAFWGVVLYARFFLPVFCFIRISGDSCYFNSATPTSVVIVKFLAEFLINSTIYIPDFNIVYIY